LYIIPWSLLLPFRALLDRLESPSRLGRRPEKEEPYLPAVLTSRVAEGAVMNELPNLYVIDNGNRYGPSLKIFSLVREGEKKFVTLNYKGTKVEIRKIPGRIYCRTEKEAIATLLLLYEEHRERLLKELNKLEIVSQLEPETILSYAQRKLEAIGIVQREATLLSLEEGFNNQ
jgi:hypothetical protein